MKIITKNKKAFFDYELKDKLLCGISLFWHEVKSIRWSNVNMKWAYVTLRDWELFLKWLSISAYKYASKLEWYNPERERKLLANKREILKLESKLSEAWVTLIPTAVWLQWSRVKIEVALWKWKKKYEKRETIKKREIDREIKRRMKV